MRRILLFLFSFVVLSMLCLSSCRTVETKVEYVPVEYDFEELLRPITEQRPQPVKLIDAPSTLSDIMQNSVSFQYAYETWRDYALALEGFYKSLGADA